MPPTTETAAIIAPQPEKLSNTLKDSPASHSETNSIQPKPSESAPALDTDTATSVNGKMHVDPFILDAKPPTLAEKSPSISSLSSLSSSSPEPSHDLLPPVIAHDGDNDDDFGESEAETERLDPGELKALDEMETKQQQITIRHRIEEITLPKKIVDTESPELLSHDKVIADIPLSPVLKKRLLPIREDEPASSAVLLTESKQNESKPKRLKNDKTSKPEISDAQDKAQENPTEEKSPPSEHESLPDADEEIEDAEAATNLEQQHAPSEEDIQAQRKEAISYLTEIEVEFAKLRDSIHADKMARFIAEIEMCAEGTHPDLANTYTQIENLRKEKIRRAEKRREYERICIDNQIRASRDQLHQQYLKDTADTRANLLLKTTEEWYRVNRERRVMDALVPEYGYRVSKDVTVQTVERKARDKEVQILHDLGRNIGFPVAPDMKAGTEEEIEEDLQLLNMAMAQRRY
ncbi:hypothetical protein D0Z03_000671 [Geotrichum reessii]|nr:hypothetical protein D0Z03_000671 [Galactomyces reessii]